jgi:hypothetical protein
MLLVSLVFDDEVKMQVRNVPQPSGTPTANGTIQASVLQHEHYKNDG